MITKHYSEPKPRHVRRVNPQRSCKLGERRSHARLKRKGNATPLPRNLTTDCNELIIEAVISH